jgi:CheY-like chemotaxis protein
MTLITPRQDSLTVTTSRVAPAQRVDGSTWVPRSFATLVTDQLAAMAAFQEHRHAVESAVEEPGMSREQRLDARRRLDVLRRQHEAVLAATSQSMEGSGGVLHAMGPRALLVHRNEWLRRRVAQDLERCGVEVVAQLDNGAEGVGALIAEQPDLLFVEDTLPMVSGLQVLHEARRYAPRTLLAAQVGYDDQISAALDAGALAAFTRRIPPADIGAELARLVAV